MSGRLSSKTIEGVRPSIKSIEENSIEVLIKAYEDVLIDGQYDLDWDEESFSAHLVKFMKKVDLRTTYKLTIILERHLQDEDKPPIGDNHPKKAPRIDISIITWTSGVEEEHFFEAKNLCQNSWDKVIGTKVDAASYQRRYIKTGIENFRRGRYYNGSLVGYVLQGEILPIVEALNKRLAKDTNTLCKIEKIRPINDFSHIYHSKHITPESEEFNIKHIFLKF